MVINTAQDLAMAIYSQFLEPLGGSITKVEPIQAMINALVLRRIDHYIMSEKLKTADNKPKARTTQAEVQPPVISGIIGTHKIVNVGSRRF